MAEQIEQIVTDPTSFREPRNQELIYYKLALDEAAIVAITDQHGIIKQVNDNFCKISGYTADELIGRDHRIINSGYHSKAFMNDLWSTISRGEVWKNDVRNRAKDGTIYWVSTTIVPFLDARNKPYQFLVIRFDITERKKAEQKLQKINRLHQFFTAINHSILHCRDEQALFESISSKAISVGKLDVARIGIITEKNWFEGSSCSSPAIDKQLLDKYYSTDYSSDLMQSSLSATAFRENKVKVSHDVRNEPQLAGFRKQITECGLKSSIALPLRRDGMVVGICSFASGEENYFETEELSLLQEAAEDISFALDRFENERVHTRMRQALVTSETRFRDFFENAPEAIVILDTRTLTFIKYNTNAYKLFGCRGTEQAISSPTQISPKYQPDGTASLQGIIEHVTAALQGEKPVFEWTIIDSAGRQVITEVRLTRLSGNDNHMVMGCVTDITERKAKEQKIQLLLEQLEFSERRFKGLIEMSYDIITVLNEDLQPLYRSPSTERVLGYTDQERARLSAFDLVHPDDEERFRSAFLETLSFPGKSVAVSFRHRHRNGNYLWLEGVFTNTLNDPSIQGIIANFKDVTGKREAENTIRTFAANLEAIIENTDAAIYSLDRDLRYVFFNNQVKSSMLTLNGYNLKVGDRVIDYLQKHDPESAEWWSGVYRRVLEGEIVSFEKEFSLAGKFVCVSFSLYPIKQKSEIIGVSCFVHDVTKQKMEQALKEKITADLLEHNASLQQFSYILSHNLRAPVARLLGITQLIKNNYVVGEEKERMLDQVSVAANQMDSIICDLNDILAVRNDVSERKELVCISSVVDEVIAIMDESIAKENVVVNTDFSKIRRVKAVKSYLHSICYNLISNSIKYARRDVSANITITSEIVNNVVILSFEDNGMGINMKLYGSSLFGLYKRFHPGTEGKGMGLFMLKAQVEAMGGRVTIESEVGRGTKFIIELENQ